MLNITPSNQDFIVTLATNAQPVEGALAMLAVMPDRLLNLEQVMAIVCLGKTMIYRLIGEGIFPRQIKPGGYATRWSEREVYGWIAEQGAARSIH